MNAAAGMPGARGSRARGFTLIELLVALLILGIMSALGYGAYRAARLSAGRTEESLTRSREIELGMRLMVMDFGADGAAPGAGSYGAEPAADALRGASGNGTSAASNDTSTLGANSSMHFNSDPGFQSNFSSTSTTNLPLVDLTRGGWSNTAGQQRSTLQRVSYALINDVVKRSYSTDLDTVQGTKPVVQDLLSGVKTIQFRYMDQNLTWQSQWPPINVAQPESLWIRPVAVEVTVEFKDWGTVRRLIEVAG